MSSLTDNIDINDGLKLVFTDDSNHEFICTLSKEVENKWKPFNGE